ncbi:MAG TPA: hypothetical protein VK558_09825 [Patescibacteria group bacterium]|nr:hypothetical protein [Patescibacteria group bacterium]
MRRVQYLIGSMLAFTLAACSGPVVSQPGSAFNQIDSIYNYGAGGRDLRLTVRGNPFPMPADVFAHVVEADVQVGLLRQPTHPTLTPGPTAKDNYELVFVFSPALTLRGDDLCKGRGDQAAEAAPVAGGTVTVRAIAAFCVAGRAETEIVGETQAEESGDVRFSGMMRQMMLSLFRPDVRDNGHGRGVEVF